MITSRSELRNTVQVTPIPVVLEAKAPTENGSHTQAPAAYGTRLSTVLLVKRTGEVYFVERDIWSRGPDGTSIIQLNPSRQREFRFNLDVDALRKNSGVRID